MLMPRRKESNVSGGEGRLIGKDFMNIVEKCRQFWPPPSPAAKAEQETHPRETAKFLPIHDDDEASSSLQAREDLGVATLRGRHLREQGGSGDPRGQALHSRRSP